MCNPWCWLLNGVLLLHISLQSGVHTTTMLGKCPDILDLR